MSRLCILTVSGGGSPPYRKIVSVQDPIRFLGTMRAKELQHQLDVMSRTVWETPEAEADAQANLLRTLKVRLYETGLKDYPETDEGVEALYKRFDAGDQERWL